MHNYWRHLVAGIAMTLLALPTLADPPTRPGIAAVAAGSLAPAHEQALLNAMQEPFLAGRDTQAALQGWFDGLAAAAQGRHSDADQAWRQALQSLAEPPQPLPPAEWSSTVEASFDWIKPFNHPDLDGCDAYAVQYQVKALKLYAVLVLPAGAAIQPQPDSGALPQQYPLLLYLHGAAYGVPTYALPWLARHARAGYAVVGPAMRGEDLFVKGSAIPPGFEQYRCDGQIENLDGEVDDALAAVSAAQKLAAVAPGKFAVIGHSFGAGVGLLAATRHPDAAAVVSYDAWLTNPFRFYWDRMRRAADNWGSWGWFCELPVDQQLTGLMRRSITHHADRVQCPLLLFLGGAYAGSVFHTSHADLVTELKRHDKQFELDEVKGGGHNFVLYYNSPQARYAYNKHMRFLNQHLPAGPRQQPPAAAPAGP